MSEVGSEESVVLYGWLVPGSCKEMLVSCSRDCLLVERGCEGELLSGSMECLPVENGVKESFSDSAEDDWEKASCEALGILWWRDPFCRNWRCKHVHVWGEYVMNTAGANLMCPCYQTLGEWGPRLNYVPSHSLISGGKITFISYCCILFTSAHLKQNLNSMPSHC